MDITIEVMLPPRGSTEFTAEGNNKYPMLGVVTVYDHRKTVAVVGMLHTGYVHVTGVPDDKFDKIKLLLERENTIAGADGLIYVGKRCWAGVVSRLSSALQTRLLTNRQIGESGALTWDTFKTFIRNIAEQRDFTDADIA